jgi:hypothetical protein
MAVPVVFAVAGLVLVLGSWVAYMATVPSGKVPARPFGHLAAQGGGALIAAWGIASSFGSGAGVLLPIVAGGTAVSMSSLFFFLYSQRATPEGQHHKAVEFSTGRFTIFGIPLALVPSLETMAIPTTLIVDEEGIIRWIDQSEDYRLRSDEERVLAEARALFART